MDINFRSVSIGTSKVLENGNFSINNLTCIYISSILIMIHWNSFCNGPGIKKKKVLEMSKNLVKLQVYEPCKRYDLRLNLALLSGFCLAVVCTH